MQGPDDDVDTSRRGFLRTSGTAVASAGLIAGGRAAVAAPAAEASVAQPAARATNGAMPAGIALRDDMTTSDILVETLIAWGATAIFGMVGDGIAGVIEAIRKRSDRIR